MTSHRIYKVPFADVYPHYVKKVETKGRTKAELDEIIHWLTGYSQQELETHLVNQTDFETFYGKAKLNPKRTLITGRICGIKVEEIEDPLMQNLRLRA